MKNFIVSSMEQIVRFISGYGHIDAAKLLDSEGFSNKEGYTAEIPCTRGHNLKMNLIADFDELTVTMRIYSGVELVDESCEDTLSFAISIVNNTLSGAKFKLDKNGKVYIEMSVGFARNGIDCDTLEIMEQSALEEIKDNFSFLAMSSLPDGVRQMLDSDDDGDEDCDGDEYDDEYGDEYGEEEDSELSDCDDGEDEDEDGDGEVVDIFAKGFLNGLLGKYNRRVFLRREILKWFEDNNSADGEDNIF